MPGRDQGSWRRAGRDQSHPAEAEQCFNAQVTSHPSVFWAHHPLEPRATSVSPKDEVLTATELLTSTHPQRGLQLETQEAL